MGHALQNQMGVSKNNGENPQIIHLFIGCFHYKPSILGVSPLFLETSRCTLNKKETHQPIDNLDLLKMSGRRKIGRTYSPKWWFNGDESHGTK